MRIHIAELDLVIGRWIPDPETPPHYTVLRGLVRLHGSPIGWVDATLGPRACSGQELTTRVLATHGDAIVRHLLTDALLDGRALRDGGELFETSHPEPASGPRASLTVAVCTRNRNQELAGCLASLATSSDAPFDVLVVDNGTNPHETQATVRDSHAAARYVREPCAGLSWARNRAIAESRSDILAFVDDDARVDRQWAGAIVDLMTQCPEVMAVTGLVVPEQLETAAQIAFEDHGGFGRGFSRRWIRRTHDGPVAPRLANTGTFGSGTNVAFRRAVFNAVGLFDVALGAGTATGGGEDLDMFFRVIEAGHTLVYEPAAIVRHRHREDFAALRDQIESWGSGMQAFLLRSRDAYPAESPALMRLRHGLLALYYPRRVLESLINRKLHLSLTTAELRGALAARALYAEARLTASAAGAPVLAPVRASVMPQRRRRRGDGTALRIILDLAQPLPAVVVGRHDANRLRIDVHLGKRSVGTIEIVTGGQAVRAPEVADAIASRLFDRLVDVRGSAAALRNAFGPRPVSA